jgi:hypothetical protein
VGRVRRGGIRLVPALNAPPAEDGPAAQGLERVDAVARERADAHVDLAAHAGGSDPGQGHGSLLEDVVARHCVDIRPGGKQAAPGPTRVEPLWPWRRLSPRIEARPQKSIWNSGSNSGKAKLSQNRSDADIAGTITGLDAGSPTERAVAERMVGAADQPLFWTSQ